MRHLATACLTLVLLFSSAAPARAAPDDAGALVREGIARFERGDYDAARADFARAYAAVPRVATLLDLALAELAAHAPLEALGHFREYAADPRASPDAAARVREKMIPRAMAETGHVQVTLPQGAAASVDGRPVPASGTVDVPAGRHAFELRFAGYTTRIEVVAPAGEVIHVALGRS